MSLDPLNSSPPLCFAEDGRQGTNFLFDQVKPSTHSLPSVAIQDGDGELGEAAQQSSAVSWGSVTYDRLDCINQTAPHGDSTDREHALLSKSKSVLSPISPQSQDFLGAMWEILETDDEDEETLSQPMSRHSQNSPPRRSWTQTELETAGRKSSNILRPSSSGTKVPTLQGVDDLSTLIFCLKLPRRSPQILLESECKICSKRFSERWMLKGQETAVELPCCARLIGHICIERLLRLYQKRTKVCPWGCPLIDEDGRFITIPTSTTEISNEASQLWDVPDPIDYKELRNRMSSERRKLYLSRRSRVAAFVTRALGRRGTL